MLNYLIRRLLYAVPILFGVILISFLLSNVVVSPEAQARAHLGQRANAQSIAALVHLRGQDKPMILNLEPGQDLTDSQFLNHVKNLMLFRLGNSFVTKRDLNQVFIEGAVPSLLITLPAFIVGLLMAISISLYLVFVRNSALDKAGVLASVALMSLPAMVYIIFGQAIVALAFNYFPAFGFSLDGGTTLKFLLLPVALMAVMGLGGDVRLYRAIFLDEIAQDYVRTAQAKGVSNSRLLFVHVLKNGMISLITLVVAYLPRLVMGSLLVENFFGIPGLGNVLVLAIQHNDQPTMLAAVYLGSILYLVGLILTDVCYALVDPRIRLS